MLPDVIAIDASRANARVRTGTEWYSYEVIRAMIALPDRPTLSLYHRSQPSPTLTGHRVRNTLITRRRLWTHLGLSSAMRRDRPPALFVPSHVIPVIRPGVSVVTIHDLGYLTEPDAHPPRTRQMLDLATRWNARAGRRIIAISQQTRDDLVLHYRVPPDKISVVHSGIDHDRFRVMNQSDIQSTLQRLRISQPYIFFLSTIQPRKNLDRLIEAFERLDADNLHLVIGGASGWLDQPIETRIRNSAAANRIQRLGFVHDDDVPALYNGAEVFALPSLYEGFGMGVLEAMACGCPVVTSNRSSLPEVAGNAAVLVDPHDVTSICDGLHLALSERRATLRASGFARAQQFSWKQTATLTLAAIKSAQYDR